MRQKWRCRNPACRKRFQPRNINHVFCSPECAKIYSRDAARKQQKAAREIPAEHEGKAVRCRSCGGLVFWQESPVCGNCGKSLKLRLAGRTSLRDKVGERDGWRCHRCSFLIDRALKWPHPLAAVADHYPIPRNLGGPAILDNLRIAHSVCNGNAIAVIIWHEKGCWEALGTTYTFPPGMTGDSPYPELSPWRAYAKHHGLSTEQYKLLRKIGKRPLDPAGHVAVPNGRIPDGAVAAAQFQQEEWDVAKRDEGITAESA